jgi:hypothetical protein
MDKGNRMRIYTKERKEYLKECLATLEEATKEKKRLRDNLNHQIHINENRIKVIKKELENV